MLQRVARQVLSSGKANEPVSDGNGRRPNHSIFTSYLLDALDGKAATAEGTITASSVMAYVYEHVGKDQYSRQTPHHGHIDGDGDFIFDLPRLQILEEASSDGTDDLIGRDVLITLSPQVTTAPIEVIPIVDEMKELLSDPSKRIKLSDFITKYTRKYLEEVDVSKFPVQVPVTKEEFVSRVERYEKASGDLQKIAVLLAQWGSREQLSLLETMLHRVSESERPSAGPVVYLYLTWYPVQLIMYAGGISAVASKNYSALKIVLETLIQARSFDPKRVSIVVPVFEQLANLHDNFKWLPGREKNYVPRSEHLFSVMQPLLEDLLFLGRRYESCFDQFEVISAASFSEVTNQNWAPPGRFVWKQRGFGSHSNPISELIEEAESNKDSWGLVQSGMFDRSSEKFTTLAKALMDRFRNAAW